MSEALHYMFQSAYLPRIAFIGKKSELFLSLFSSYLALKPSAYGELCKIESEAIQSLISSVSFQDMTSESEDINTSGFNIFWKEYHKFLFNVDDSIRNLCAETALKLLKVPDQKALDFFDFGLLDASITPPLFCDGSAIIHYFISGLNTFFDMVGTRDEYLCDSFVKVILRVSYISPRLLSYYYKKFIDSVVLSSDLNIRISIIETIHNLIVFDNNLVAITHSQFISIIFSLDYSSMYLYQMLTVFSNYMGGTKLEESFINYCLSNKINTCSKKILDKIQESLNPCDFCIPKTSPGISNISLALFLWKICEHRREEIHPYLSSCLEHAKPFVLYSKTPSVKQALEILNC